MALQVGFSSTTAGTTYDLTTADDIVILSTSNVVSTGGTAIDGTGSSHTATIYGSVFGQSAGIDLGASAVGQSNNDVVIASGANVGSSGYGVRVLSINSHITNAGTISGTNYGIIEGGFATGQSSIFNSGLIDGDEAITRYSGSTEELRILNTGTIIGDTYSFTGNFSNANEFIFNRGTMVGDINLDNGNDLYDGRGGTILGTVFGGDGNDTFIAGAMEETFDGGAGIDTIDMRMTQGERVVLNVVAGTGVSQGDLYVNCENIYGSLTGRDLLTGNGLANVFIANGGDDVMNLGGGNDKVIGGEGRDVIWGGTGNDAFIFILPTEGGDFIQDFSNSAGNDDFFQIKASGFGAGLSAGLLPAFQFQTRTDNVAQDADDRFIFRTTDNTLWFDSNGSVAGGLTMLADLQAGATVTAADILIY